MSSRIKIFISFLISILLFLLFYQILPATQRNFINILTIVGVQLSLLGITIAYIQILSIKEISNQTQSRITESIRFNNNMFMLSDISRKVGMVDEIQSFIRAEKIELCIVRMKDLKIILSSLKNQEYYQSIVSKRDFKNVFANFNINLDNLQRHSLNPKIRLDKEKIIINLDALSTLLLSVEIKLKNPQP